MSYNKPQSLLAASHTPSPRMARSLQVHPFSRPLSIQGSLFSQSSDSQRTTTDTSTIWGPGTLSGRAILALGEATIRGFDALMIRRRLATIRLRSPSLTKSMCDDLLELCRPGMYSLRIKEEALRLTLTHICVNCKYHMLVLSLCNWPQEEARMILREMMSNLMGLLHPSATELESIYNFLVAIIQVKQQWRTLAWEAAHLLRNKFQLHPPVTHPIHTLCSLSPSEVNKLPLSTMQITHSATMRSEMWLSLYSCGMSSQARVGHRMSEVEKIIGQALHPNFSMQIPTTPQVFDALVDTIIFTSEKTFGSKLRASAIRCLLDYCRLSKQWDLIYQLFSMFDFQVQMQIFIVFRNQIPLDKLDDFVKSWPVDSAYESDFFFLLSGWVLGMNNSGCPRRIWGNK